MTNKLNMFLFLILSLGIKAQHQTKMENQNELMPKGQVIKHGKMIYTEILINASPEKVWSIFSDFEKYPLWNPFITSLKGKPSEGCKIEVVLQPPAKKAMVFKPKVLVYETLHQFRWIGKLGISRLFDGEHVFILKDNNDGTTTFIQHERFRGLLVPFLNKMLNTNTKAGFMQMNVALKSRCEN
jgi:hypothetical protein